jgi:hypothetical protein
MAIGFLNVWMTFLALVKGVPIWKQKLTPTWLILVLEARYFLSGWWVIPDFICRSLSIFFVSLGKSETLSDNIQPCHGYHTHSGIVGTMWTHFLLSKANDDCGKKSIGSKFCGAAANPQVWHQEETTEFYGWHRQKGGSRGDEETGRTWV